jgi:hypothetical protein
MKTDMTEGAPSASIEVDLIECPRCAARLLFSRKPLPLIDSGGFESYSLKCDQCGAELVGIIDPFDDRFLVSELGR